MRYLSYRSCLGIDKPDRLCHASELETLLAIQSHGDLNPVQASRLKELQAAGDSGNPTGVYSPGQFFGGGGGNTQANSTNAAATQAALNAEIVKENQPQIAALTTQKSTLAQQYADLLKTITGAEQPAIDVGQSQANAANAARGLTPNSELALKNTSGIIAPIAGQFAGLTEQAQQGSISDLNALAQQIAALQAGNPTASLTGATNLAGLAAQIQAAQIQGSAQVAAAQAQPYVPLTAGQALGNRQTGQINLPTFNFGQA